METVDFGVRPGDILAGKYRVERVLGIGGMGAVVAAHHLQLGERVALKFLLPEALTSAEAVGRFVREARAAVRIKSDYVARVIDVGRLENSAPYMVMEYLEGTDLAGWLRRWGPLPAEQAVEFVLQACVAIADAHGLGIVHRDLKPANLFCTRRSDGQLVVKVLDFGISKLTDGAPSEPGAMAATRTSAVMGSPLYMSPEQFRSAKTVDARTDIWSLGVILFELLGGVVPFQGEGFGELAVKIATQDAPSLGEPSPGRAARAQKASSTGASRRTGSVGTPTWRSSRRRSLPFAHQPRVPRARRAHRGHPPGCGDVRGGAAASLSAPPVSVPPPSPMSVGPLGPTRPPSGCARGAAAAAGVVRVPTPWSAPSEGARREAWPPAVRRCSSCWRRSASAASSVCVVCSSRLVVTRRGDRARPRPPPPPGGVRSLRCRRARVRAWLDPLCARRRPRRAPPQGNG